MESIIDTYTRTICVNCKNRNTDLCDVRKDISDKLKCVYYKREKKHEGADLQKGRKAMLYAMDKIRGGKRISHTVHRLLGA